MRVKYYKTVIYFEQEDGYYDPAIIKSGTRRCEICEKPQEAEAAVFGLLRDKEGTCERVVVKIACGACFPKLPVSTSENWKIVILE